MNIFLFFFKYSWHTNTSLLYNTCIMADCLAVNKAFSCIRYICMNLHDGHCFTNEHCCTLSSSIGTHFQTSDNHYTTSISPVAPLVQTVFFLFVNYNLKRKKQNLSLHFEPICISYVLSSLWSFFVDFLTVVFPSSVIVQIWQ